MARLILLDSGPLGLIVRAPGRPHVARCLTWLRAILATGAVVVIPDISYYELRRELLRIRAVGSLRRLDYALDPSSGLDHLVVTTDAIIKAAEFWLSCGSRESLRRRPTLSMPMPSLPDKRRSPASPGIPSPSRRRTWHT
jgi:hypothetical protein